MTRDHATRRINVHSDILWHGNNLPFPFRVSFVPFVSLWLILFEPQRHKETSAIIGILQHRWYWMV